MLASTVWQSTLLLAIGLVSARLLSHRPARAHAALVACTLAALAAPLLTGIFGTLGLGLLHSSPVEASLSPIPLDSSSAGVGQASLSDLLRQAALVIWSAVSTVLALRLALQMFRSHRLASRTGAPADREVRKMVEAASERCGLARAPRVLAARPSLAPAVWAWSRPARLFLPSDLRPAELRAALYHELGHLNRRDHWSFLLTQFAVCVLPWNPLAWMARRRAAALAEEACDAWALASGVPPGVMARTLVTAVPTRAALGMSLRRDRKQLESRIARMFDVGTNAPQVGSRWARWAGAALVVALTGLALAQRAPAQAPDGDGVAASGRAAWSERIARLRAEGLTEVVVQPGELDLGRVEPGSTARGSLWLLNPGDEPRSVIGASASCGCTRITLPKPAIVPAGGVLELPVEMDAPAEFSAEKSKTVTLRLTGQAPVQLPVTTRTWDTTPVETDR